MATDHIDFWFTMGSTYSYLSVMRLVELERSSGIALQSRRQTSQGATRQGVEAERPQYAQGRRPSQFLRCWARNRGRAAHPRALVLVVGGGSLGALMLRKNAAGGLA
jgi:2-hydroxychromene-2-carboxylate isomerase